MSNCCGFELMSLPETSPNRPDPVVTQLSMGLQNLTMYVDDVEERSASERAKRGKKTGGNARCVLPPCYFYGLHQFPISSWSQSIYEHKKPLGFDIKSDFYDLIRFDLCALVVEPRDK